MAAWMQTLCVHYDSDTQQLARTPCLLSVPPSHCCPCSSCRWSLCSGSWWQRWGQGSMCLSPASASSAALASPRNPGGRQRRSRRPTRSEGEGACCSECAPRPLWLPGTSCPTNLLLPVVMFHLLFLLAFSAISTSKSSMYMAANPEYCAPTKPRQYAEVPPPPRCTHS